MIPQGSSPHCYRLFYKMPCVEVKGDIWKQNSHRNCLKSGNHFCNLICSLSILIISFEPCHIEIIFIDKIKKHFVVIEELIFADTLIGKSSLNFDPSLSVLA